MVFRSNTTSQTAVFENFGDKDEHLGAIIDEIRSVESLDSKELERIQRLYPKEGKGFYSKREILSAFRTSYSENLTEIEISKFTRKLQTCPTRSLSGVLPVTVLTKPFPCPGRCVFCPSDVQMPKSYLSKEPGCQRASHNRFDPYLQSWNRLSSYRDMGHPTDKVELIILGGTWSYYSKEYRRWFIGSLLKALNDFGSNVDERSTIAEFTANFPEAKDPGDFRGRYNRQVGTVLRTHHDGVLTADWEDCPQEKLTELSSVNEGAGSRCVGISIETRPDAVDEAELVFLRNLGVTKVQIGVQSLSDKVLSLNRRGHNVETSRRALSLLRAAGFKVQVHWMVNLLGGNPSDDLEDFKNLFDDKFARPDELKLYPCSLIESAELVDHYKRGEWVPYEREELEQLLLDCLAIVPPTCRVTRVIRDIPSTDIPVGNKRTNLREDVERRARSAGVRLNEIRNREVRTLPTVRSDLKLIDRVYKAGYGVEHFLEWNDTKDRIAAFLRLYLPLETPPISELAGSAIIREVHVYGRSTALGDRSENSVQHAGLGRELVKRAEEISLQNGFFSLAVISAVGTRKYYESLGFKKGMLYQFLDLKQDC